MDKILGIVWVATVLVIYTCGILAVFFRKSVDDTIDEAANVESSEKEVNNA